MRCTKCGTESSRSGKFCAECGTPLSNRCPKCTTDNNPTSKFCEECGSALAPSTEFASPSLPQARSTAADIRAMREQSATDLVEGERKTVTDLLADIRVDRADGGPRPRGGAGDHRPRANADYRPGSSLRWTVALRCSARQSTMRIIRNERSMRRCSCRRTAFAILPDSDCVDLGGRGGLSYVIGRLRETSSSGPVRRLVVQ